MYGFIEKFYEIFVTSTFTSLILSTNSKSEHFYLLIILFQLTLVFEVFFISFSKKFNIIIFQLYFWIFLTWLANVCWNIKKFYLLQSFHPCIRWTALLINCLFLLLLLFSSCCFCYYLYNNTIVSHIGCHNCYLVIRSVVEKYINAIWASLFLLFVKRKNN